MLRWGAAAYALLGILALVLAPLVRGGSGFVHPSPWLALDPTTAHVYSLLCGAAFGALLVVVTRVMVPRFSWAEELHSALRPVARQMSGPAIIVMALLSAFGEELLFRGLLGALLGVFPQALLFGVAHQIPGRSRLVWVAWATLVGLVLGGLFQLTGSLAGPIAAHALVNAMNLSYLKSHDPGLRQGLGGLLGSASLQRKARLEYPRP